MNFGNSTKCQSEPSFTGLLPDQVLILGRPRGDKRTVPPRGARRQCASCLVFQQRRLHLSFPSASSHSPSTPEVVCGGAEPGSGLSASPCGARCRCRELSGPSPEVVAPPAAAPAAAAPAAAVPVSGMLSISEERLRIKVFSGKSCSGVASQEEGKAWV